MAHGFSTPVQLDRELNRRAQQHSARTHIASGEIRRRWFLERLLARVFTYDRDRWVLKGGLALLARYPSARHSRDLDLAHQARSELDGAAAALQEAAVLDLGDMVRFTHFATRRDGEGATGRPTCRVTFTPHLGTKRHNEVTVDLITADPVAPPVFRPLQSLLNMDFGPVELQVLSLEDHLADKICAMYERHSGRPSSRVKDLVDLVLILTQDTIDGPVLAEALAIETRRRQAHGTDLALPHRFVVPEQSWVGAYPEQARSLTGVDAGLHHFESASRIADRFLSPLLRGDIVQQWDPATRTWT